jgi:methylglutaconyl-CoA hydratase
VAAVVLTGAGKYFCTGMDLGGSPMEAGSDNRKSVFDVLMSYPKPIIGRINGPCIGG